MFRQEQNYWEHYSVPYTYKKERDAGFEIRNAPRPSSLRVFSSKRSFENSTLMGSERL